MPLYPSLSTSVGWSEFTPTARCCGRGIESPNGIILHLTSLSSRSLSSNVSCTSVRSHTRSTCCKLSHTLFAYPPPPPPPPPLWPRDKLQCDSIVWRHPSTNTRRIKVNRFMAGMLTSCPTPGNSSPQRERHALTIEQRSRHRAGCRV